MNARENERAWDREIKNQRAAPALVVNLKDRAAEEKKNVNAGNFIAAPLNVYGF